MKKLPALAIVILALLMQLRVAYACEAAGRWPAEPCKAHGLIIQPQGEAPQDRGSACDIALELASRSQRQTGEHDELTAALTDLQPGFVPLAWPQAQATPYPQHRPPIPRARGPAVMAGASTYLVTSRLRI